MAGMTSEEAIYIITGLPIYRMEQEYDSKSDLMTALTMAVEALEKRTPKSVLFGRNMMTKEFAVYCPECKRIIESVHCYCWHCGQALDWSDVCE